jgi:4-hydroxybutyrate dehydrogenase
MSLIRYAARIHFADRVIEDVFPEEVRVRRIAAPLIVVDADTGQALLRVLDCLPLGCRPRILDLSSIEAGTGIWRAVQRALGEGGNPLEEGGSVEKGDCDAVIGLGGAVALAVARFANVERAAAGHPSPQWRGSEPVAAQVLCVPTLPGCLGLGPQSWSARDQRGVALSSRIPDVVFCDPSLMRPAAPARLAAAGMDALVHCLESLLATAWNPPADAMAFDGLRRASGWLERLVADPGDTDAGREMLAAALNGALASQKGLGAIHAMAHALETLTVSPESHGELHAALIKPALAFNAPAVPERLAIAAEAMQLPDAGGVADHLADLGERLGQPRSLGHLGLTSTGIDRLAAAAARARANRENPRYATAADYKRMFKSVR